MRGTKRAQATSSGDVIKQFREQGYVITKGLDFKLLDELRAASSIEAAKVRAANPGEGGGRYVAQIQPGPFADYLASEVFMAVIHDLLGSNIRCQPIPETRNQVELKGEKQDG